MNTSVRTYISSQNVNLNKSLREYISLQIEEVNKSIQNHMPTNTSIAASTWAYAGGRVLSQLDEDVTVIDLDGTYVAGIRNTSIPVTVDAPTNVSIVNTLLNSVTSSYTTYGTIGYNLSRIGSATATATIDAATISSIADRVNTFNCTGNVSSRYANSPCYMQYKTYTRP